MSVSPLAASLRRRVTPGCGVALLAAAILTTASGCAEPSPLVDVRGQIVLNGEPLSGAVVIFTPVGKGTSSFGFTDEDGFYQLRFPGGRLGALPGKHRVSITKSEQIDVEAVFPDEINPDMLTEIERVKYRLDRPDPIPARYNTKSELIASLMPEQSATEHSFQLVAEVN